MENTGLIFIPDISGFTKFIQEVEISHSRLIIQELLETLINANRIGLEISEIEGDAILFYKFGEPPPLQDIYKQVELMFSDFHRSLKAYDYRKYCQCTACVSAIDLTLKVITHYGEFSAYTVKDFNKLIGKDIIVAHQLLKNDIDNHEYWLVTQKLAEGEPINFANWMEWAGSIKQTEGGDVPFKYTQLSPLKDNIKMEPLPKLVLDQKVKVLSFSQVYHTDIISMFHATGDFNIRSKWQEGVKSVQEVNHILPRVGMRCRCVKVDGEAFIFASSYYYSEERIEFSETDEATKHVVYTTLEKLEDQKTRVTWDYYIEKSFPGQLLFNLNEKKKVKRMYEKSMENLENYIQHEKK